VATDVGDLRHIIRQGKTGYVISDSQPQLLAEKIGVILKGTNPQMGDARFIRSSVMGFGWQNVAASINDEFAELMIRNPVLTK
jgi:glycosyltransferase involved in cell wall biosynthesis